METTPTTTNSTRRSDDEYLVMRLSGITRDLKQYMVNRHHELKFIEGLYSALAELTPLLGKRLLEEEEQDQN